MYIEEIVHLLAMHPQFQGLKENGIINNCDAQNSQGNGMTEKQRAAVVKILFKYSGIMSNRIGRDITPYLKNPIFGLPIRQLIISPKKISIMPSNEYKKLIKVEFPFNEEYVQEFKKQKNNLTSAGWVPEIRAWTFQLDESSISFLTGFAERENFELDEEFGQYVQQTKHILKNMESYVPMMVLQDGTPKLVNTPVNLPELTSTEIIPALLESRKLGVSTWDDSIDNYITDSVLKTFLTNEADDVTYVDCQKNSINCLSDIVYYMSPCLFVIPGGHELEKLSMIYNFLNSININNADISVMFRLSSETGANFNTFVKEQGINSPIKDTTRAVIVSTKLPKSIFKSGIKFNSIVNLGQHSPHYTIRNFVEKHENLIYFSDKKPKKGLEFAFV
jgi:hypothetical protein